MRITLATASKSISGTALALRQAIWRKQDPSWHVCGLPEILYSDNGSDFTSQHLEQVGADLKMQLVFSTPGIPRGRGRIERFFATLTQMFLCDLPGYVPPKGGMRGKTRAHTSGAGPLVGRWRSTTGAHTARQRHYHRSVGKQVALYQECPIRLWRRDTLWRALPIFGPDI
jgi:transposase InsO family protein